MPRGYSDYYAEFVAVTRHVLQVKATGKKDLLAKMLVAAKGDWVEGLQVHDASNPVLIHEPFGHWTMGRQEDGPSIMVGNVFGDDPNWLRELAASLLKLADEQEEGKPKARLLKRGELLPSDTCLRCQRTGTVEATLTVAKPREQLLYKRCRTCGWRKNLGWYGDAAESLYTKIRDLNPRKKAT